jgi:transposase InsO family protein
MGVSRTTAWRWWRRYQEHGQAGLVDRSSRPRWCPHRTPACTETRIRIWRHLARRGPVDLARRIGVPASTVGRVLTRHRAPLLRECDPVTGAPIRASRRSAVRYEHPYPGSLVHIDVKKLGRIQGGAGKRVGGQGHSPYNPQRTDAAGKRRNTVGWEYVHLAVDDYSRLAYAEVLADEKATTAIAFLRRALRFFARYRIRVERILTDNGSAYRSMIHALACRRLGIRHLRTRPYRPQTNGKAERFVRTLLNGWAYGAIYRSSAERTHALYGWLWHYNHRRRHSALGHQAPVTRTNVLGSYT